MKRVMLVLGMVVMFVFSVSASYVMAQPGNQCEENVDLDYIYKYWRAYALAANAIANWEKTPYWMPGDKFEPVGNQLYQK